MISTRQAAERLGVSSRRVVSLIESGDLVAERLGRSWMVDERSVETRLRMPRLKGRPKLGQKNLMNLKRFTLMNRNHEVFEFVHDAEKKTVSIESLCDGVAWAPLGAGPQGRAPDPIDFAMWFKRRHMPPLRPEASALMRAAGVSSVDALMFGSLGLNLSDQYWFKPDGVDIDWHDVNFFENGYERASSGVLRTPDSSTPGALEKRWERIDGSNCLVKGSSGVDQREPFNEVLATKLMGRLLADGEYVAYRLVQREGRTCSSCPTFITEHDEFVPANDVAVRAGITEGRDFYRAYVEFCEHSGIEGARTFLSKMIVCDHIMSNFDRHRANFGLVRTVETLDGWRMAPLFDNGAGFFSRATMQELERERYTWTANPFDEYPSQQLARVEDMSWYDPEMLEGFADEVREILSSNPSLPDAFADHAARHVRRNIDAVDDLAAERCGRYF